MKNLVRTDQLMNNYLKSEQFNFKTQQKELIKPIKGYFPHSTNQHIQINLLRHGLFNPNNTDKDSIKKWVDQNHRKIVSEHFAYLQKQWSGPNLKIFLFPIDTHGENIDKSNRLISGLSFSDKIFLFCDWKTDKMLLYAALAHEYSHSIRLQKFHDNDAALILKDTLILEGIAECITKELYDISFLPERTEANEDLEADFEKWIKPHLDISNKHPLHQHLIYGNNQIPGYLGYFIGAHLVDQWLTKHQIKINELIYIPTEDFFK